VEKEMPGSKDLVNRRAAKLNLLNQSELQKDYEFLALFCQENGALRAVPEIEKRDLELDFLKNM
jgi:hypothetical protein